MCQILRCATYLCLSSTVALCATFVGQLYERRVHYLELGERYAALLSSDTCTNLAIRVASSGVNRCDEADHFQRTTSPSAHALMDALQYFSICGYESRRCSDLLHGILDMGGYLQILVCAVLLTLVYVLVHKHRIDAITSRHSPLDGRVSYPSRVPLYGNDYMKHCE
jgi:hypothetical protein